MNQLHVCHLYPECLTNVLGFSNSFDYLPQERLIVFRMQLAIVLWITFGAKLDEVKRKAIGVPIARKNDISK
jgi:hypothetical protein